MLRGRIGQIETELAGARNETASARGDVLEVKIELIKALLRLETVPRLETDMARA